MTTDGGGAPMRASLAWVAQRVAAAADRRDSLPAAERENLHRLVTVLCREHAEAAPDDRSDDRLERLATVFGLNQLDADLLVVAAAAEADANVARAYAALQGDPRAQRPSVGLALELCGAGSLSAGARSRLSAAAPLHRGGLVAVDGEQPLLARPLRVPDRVVNHLLGDDTVDSVTAAMAAETVDVQLPEQDTLAAAITCGVPLCWVRSSPGAAGLSLAGAGFTAAGIPHLAVDLHRTPTDTDLRTAVEVVIRDAALLGAGLVVTGGELLAEEGNPPLLRLLETAAVPVVVAGRRAWDATWLRRLPVVIEAPPTPVAVRQEIWRSRLGPDVDLADDVWADLLALRLSPEDIAQVARHARTVSTARGEALSGDTVRDAVRRLSGSHVPGTWGSRRPPTFDDLVLPPAPLQSLKEVVSWARHREQVLAQGSIAGKGGKGRGILALFSGAPGTGKTLAAGVIAGSLGLDLYTVELATVVDKYIGETEKNLERVFREAEALNVVLFFDEADSLFGSRSEVRDARDRYANLEVAYLLQRMEQYDGIAILSTNLRGNLDAAFSRRLHFMIHFPDPDVPTRRRLWEVHLAELSRLDADDPVDLDHLAQQVEVAGGDIRNIVLAAAYAAASQDTAVGMRHLAAAAQREYVKLGRRSPADGFHPPRPRPAAETVGVGRTGPTRGKGRNRT